PRREEEVAEIAHHMAALPADLDPFGPWRYRFGHARLRVELRPHLVEIGDAQGGAELDPALVGRERTQHQPQQRGLAGAVRADEADAVAALDQAREVAHHPALAGGRVEALADVDEFGDPPPGPASRIEPDAQVALAFAALVA